MILTDQQLHVTTKAAGNFRTEIEELSQIPKEEIIDSKRLQSHIESTSATSGGIGS